MSADNTSIEAIILAGGKGTRLQSVVDDRPKPMAEVAGRPFLEWLLLLLQGKGIRRTILCTGYLADKVEAYFGDGKSWDMETIYSQEANPLGTAGAVRNALNHISTDRILVMNGDSYCSFDLGRLVGMHEQKKASATMWLVEMDDCRRYGSVKIDEEGAVLSFQEKSSDLGSGLVNAGIYLLERELVISIPDGRAVSLETDVFPKLVGHGLFAITGEGSFLDIGTPESYAVAKRVLFKEYLS